MKNKTNILTLYLLLVCTATLFAQTFSPEEQKQIDSLNAIINNKASHDTSLAAAYVSLSDILYVSNLDTMIPLCTKARQIAEKALSDEALAKLDPVSKSLKSTLADALNNIGYVHTNQGDIPLGLDYQYKSLKLEEEIGNKKGMASSYNNIGYVHLNQGDILLALDYFHKSLKIKKEIKDKEGMATAYNNLASIQMNQGDIPLALDYLHESLKIREETMDKRGIAESYNNMGFIYSNYGDPSIISSKEESLKSGQALALDYYDKSLKMREEIDDKHGMAYSYANIGRLYMKIGSLAEARTHGEKGLITARELGFPEQIKYNAALLSQIAQKQDNWKEALEMRNLEIQMRDSINSEAAQKAAVQQEMKYEYEKVQAVKQKEHEKQMAIAAEQEEKQKIISIASGGALVLVIAFLLFVFNRLKITRSQKQIIENTHQKLAEHHKEIQDSIKYAKRIQEAILPNMAAMQQALKDSFVFYKPKDVVAGDFYWMEQYGTKVYFAAADCTGHGVPGAMVSVVCSNALSKALLEEMAASTGELLDKTRNIVINRLAKSGEEVKDGMDVSLCTIDFNNMTLQWSGANNPLWIVRDGEVISYKHDKQPIGIHYDMQPFTTHDIILQKNDTIYIFTDGYQDQFGGEKEKKYMTKRLKQKLLNIQKEKMDDQNEILDKEFEQWRGQHEQVDDVCVIGVRIS